MDDLYVNVNVTNYCTHLLFLPAALAEAGLEVTFQVGQGSIVGGGGSDISKFGGGGGDICQNGNRYTLGDGTLSC